MQMRVCSPSEDCRVIEKKRTRRKIILYEPYTKEGATIDCIPDPRNIKQPEGANFVTLNIPYLISLYVRTPFLMPYFPASPCLLLPTR